MSTLASQNQSQFLSVTLDSRLAPLLLWSETGLDTANWDQVRRAAWVRYPTERDQWPLNYLLHRFDPTFTEASEMVRFLTTHKATAR